MKLSTRSLASRLLLVAASISSTASLAAAAPADREALIVMGRKPEPPAMAARPVVRPATQPAGSSIDIVDDTCKTTLYVPADYVVPANGNVNLTIHFHGEAWFAIDEHLRRGLREPLLVANLGQGSSIYARAFGDPDRLGRIIALVETQLGPHAKVARLDLTSFSAGYGAVREIVKYEKYVSLVRRVILCDSLYAGWDPATTQPGATSQPSPGNMKPWEPFLDQASKGQKTFVLTHSFVPTSYANTAATAAYICAKLAVPRVELPANSSAASGDPQYPLQYRADIGHLHIWGYGGTDAGAHMTHVRHMADVWMALDACGDR